jgi:peroxiredoxin
MITSTDERQSQIVVKDLSLKMPLLSDPSCRVFHTYQVGQALGAPLPAQFVLDKQGKLGYKHLFSFLDHNAGVEKLLKQFK